MVDIAGHVSSESCDRKGPETAGRKEKHKGRSLFTGGFRSFLHVFLKIYRFAVFFLSFSDGHTVRIMVMKQAAPPMKLEMGSARNTP